MIVWGGSTGGYANTGGVYDPGVVVLYTLTVSTAGGSGGGNVSSSPAGIDCGSDCAEDYDGGTEVTLTPTPAIGSTFTSWSGACTGAGACVVTMDAAKAVTATFTLNQYELTVGTDGTGSGTVTSSPGGIDCGSDCSEAYAPGTEVTLTPAAAIGSAFSGWSGACTGTGACVVTLDGAKSVEATFDLSGGTGFYTLAPCRMADTRGAAGPALGANTTRTFPVAGICDVPSTAKAVAINVTVTGATDAGNLRLYPAGGAVPPTSAINFVASRTRANNAVIPLGTGGEMSVRCNMSSPTGHVDFVLDVTAYFE
jgi:hypothetical protein